MINQLKTAISSILFVEEGGDAPGLCSVSHLGPDDRHVLEHGIRMAKDLKNAKQDVTSLCHPAEHAHTFLQSWPMGMACIARLVGCSRSPAAAVPGQGNKA